MGIIGGPNITPGFELYPLPLVDFAFRWWIGTHSKGFHEPQGLLLNVRQLGLMVERCSPPLCYCCLNSAVDQTPQVTTCSSWSLWGANLTVLDEICNTEYWTQVRQMHFLLAYLSMTHSYFRFFYTGI